MTDYVYVLMEKDYSIVCSPPEPICVTFDALVAADWCCITNNYERWFHQCKVIKQQEEV